MDNSPALDARLATVADAADLLGVIHEAFSAREPVEPPAAALSDTVADIEEALRDGYGVLAVADEQLVGGLLISLEGEVASLSRVSVLPSHAGRGVATFLAEVAIQVAVDAGAHRVKVFVRKEFPQLVNWWQNLGFEVTIAEESGYWLGCELPVRVEIPTAEAMRQLGNKLAGLLRPGDVIVATGDLGAGKTTLTQGIGEGLGVEGPVISPTFVLSRVHRNLGDGPDLVHVDAYRLATSSELADIDLDESLNTSVTLIEWGKGLAEWLSEDRLEIDILREDDDDSRTVYFTGIGARWSGVLAEMRSHS